MGRLLQRKLKTFGPTQSSDLNHDNQIITEHSAALEEKQGLRKASSSYPAVLLFQRTFQAGIVLLLSGWGREWSPDGLCTGQ